MRDASLFCLLGLQIYNGNKHNLKLQKAKKILTYQRCRDNMIIEKGASDRRLALYFAKIAA